MKDDAADDGLIIAVRDVVSENPFLSGSLGNEV
jgi:hypothetical protein